MPNHPPSRQSKHRNPIRQYEILDYSHVKAKIDDKGKLPVPRVKDLEADEFEYQRREQIWRQKEERRKFEGEERRKSLIAEQLQQQQARRSSRQQGQGEGQKDKIGTSPKKCQLQLCWHKFIGRTRKKWLFSQGVYPPAPGWPEEPPPPYEPSKQRIHDTSYARQLAAAMDIRIIRYPEPFAGLLLTSHYLEPKNFKVMVNRRAIFYSYDYTPYIPDVSNFVQQFSQIILDAKDRVTAYQECSQYPNETRCLSSCLDCTECKFARNKNEYFIRAPNGFLLGKIVRTRLRRYGGLFVGFDLYNTVGKVVFRIKKQLWFTKRKFAVVSENRKVQVATIYRRIAPWNKNKLLPDHCDYRILMETAQTDVELKLLLVGAALFIDFLLDGSYRPFIRYGSKVIPTFNGRYSH